MSYILTKSDGDHIKMYQNVIKNWWKSGTKDVLFITEENEKFMMNSRILSLYSPMMTDLCKDLLSRQDILIINFPFQYNIIESLATILTKGKSDTVDVDDVMLAADLLGINVHHLEVVLSEKRTSQKKKVTIKSENIEIQQPPQMTLPGSRVRILPIDNISKLTPPGPAESSALIESANITIGESLPNVKESFPDNYDLVQDLDSSFRETEASESKPPSEKKPKLQNNAENQCSNCDNKYSTPDGLRRHMLTHTVEDGKPFACLICEKKFTRKDKLNLHFKKAHTGYVPIQSMADDKERLECNECGKTFSRQDTLTRHTKNFHVPLVGHISFPEN